MQNCVLFINTPLSPSFVSHGGTLNQVDISIRSSDLSSHDTPFLSSGLFSRFNLISSTFSNLSTSLLANSKDGVWSDDVTDSGVIASSNFDRCDACCTGALYSSNRFRTLSTLNCSFSHFTLTNEVQQTLTETASFIGDVFASLTRNGEGGAIQFKPSDASAVLTVTNCAFTTCNSTSSFKGGAIHASNGKVVVAGTTFTECTGHSGGAIATTAAQLTVSDSAFYSCKAICLSWIEARGDRNFHAEAWTEENERVNGGGGAMWIELLSSYYLISACLFESCLAPSFGGGVVLWPYGCAAPTFFRMVNCMFLGTTVSTIKIERSGGQNVMIACNKFTANDYDGYLYFQSEFNNQDGILTKRLDSLFTDTTDTEAKNVQLGTSSYVYGATVESMDADVYVATSGSDVFNCGDQSNLCKTVTYAGNKVKANCKVIVAAGTYSSENGEETCILVNAKTVRIEGAGSSSTSVSFIKPTFFQTSNMKMTTGTISVSAISLTLNADSTDTWHLIEVDGSGSATLTDCILKGTRSAQNGRLVSIIGGSLAATGCEFNDIQSTLSTGAAIHADLASSSSLIILSSSFTNCKLGSESENVGAALFINLRDNAKYYYMRELTFAGGEANRAADIFISTPTLDKESEYLTKYKFEVSWQNNAADNLRIRCFSRDPSFKPQELGIPFYIAGQTELFVNSSKSDSEDCGWQDAPCQSVTYAGSQISLSGMTVFVMVSAYLKGTTDIAGSTIQPEHESDQATLQITAVSNLTITDTTTATISRIDFAFQTPLSSSTPLLSTSTGSFILQSCSFKSSGSVVAAQTLISVSATGSITTDGLRVADISFSSPAISVASSSISVGDVTFSSCSFTGTLPASLVSISPSSPSTLLSVGKVSFTSFSTTSSPSSSSELTLALISGPQTSTFAASTATLITSAAGSLTSNTAISFSGSSSSSAPLLKLSLGSTLSATVSNTKVVFPSSTNAGSTAALADTTSSSLSFSASTIDTSNLSGFFTSSIFAVPANTLSISFSSLSSFLSGSSKVMSVPLARVTGGSLSLSKVKLDTTILSSSFTSSVVVQSAGKVDISDSEFWSIASSASGSVISATLRTGASLSLSAVTFTSCTSTKDGGPLHVTVNGGTFSTSGTITFDQCSAAGNGNCLYLSNSNLVTLLEVGILNSFKPSLPNDNALFSSTQKERFFGYQSDTSLGSLLYYWYPHTTSATSTHIHSSGEDHSLCGLVSLPCQSISTALSHPNAQNTFSVDSPLTLSETVTVTQTATLTSSSSTAITVSSTGFISVASNELTLSNLMFTGPGSATSQSFVSVTSTGSLTVSSCSFTSFSSSTNGGALNVALTAGSLSITGTTFKKCSSSLNGGAIFVDLTSLSSPGSYSLSLVTFGTAAGEVNSCGGNGKGSDLFISVASGKTSLISSASLTGSYFTTPSGGSSSTFTTSEMSKYEFSEVDGSSGSILYLLHPYTGGQLFVDSESAADNDLCGNKYLACQTLPLGHSSSKDSSDGPKASVFLSTNVALSEAFSSEKTVLWTSSESSDKTISFASNDSILISSDHLSLSHLVLTVSADQYSKSFFTVSGGLLSVSDCEFKSIASSASGSAISATLGTGASLSLTSVAFTSCTSTADGGALHVTVNGGTFTTSGTITFDKCSATGNGNCLYLSNSNLVTLLEVGILNSFKPSLPNDNALFSSTQKERFFGYQSDTSLGSLLYYWYPHTTSATSTHIHSSGEDHSLCGLVSLPCQSISTALTHPNSKNTFSVDSPLTLSETVTVTQTATLTASSSTAITVSSTGSISVTSNTLTLSNLMFTGPGSATSQSFVTVSSTGSLSVSSCSFTSFSSSTNGGALNIALTTGSLSITGTTFKKCSSSLNGGAIFVDLTSLSSPGSYSLSSVAFGTADGDLNSCWGSGSDLFISVASGQTSLISFASLTEMSKYEFLEESGSSGSILYLLHPYTGGQLFVNSESAADNALCGHKYLACQTLPLGHSSSKDSSDGTEASVFLSTSVTLSDAFSSMQTVKWTSDPSSRKIITIAADVSIEISSGHLSLSHLILTVSAAPYSKSFFTVNGGSLSVSSCLFMSIESSASGSAISATLGSGTSLSLVSVIFTSCTSTANGGALQVTVSGGTFSTSGTIIFEGCSATGDGQSLYLSNSDLVSLLKVGTLDSIKPSLPENNALFSSTEKERFFGCQSDTSKGSLLHYWYPRTSNVFRVNSEGDEHPLCGIASLPCASLEYAHDSLAQSESELVLTSDIQLASQLDAKFEAETIKCEESLKKTLTIQSTGSVTVGSSAQKNMDYALTFSTVSFLFDTAARSSPFLHVSGGILVFAACIFGTSTATTTLPNNVVLVDRGTLTMTTSTIQNMSSSYPLLSLTGGQTTLTTLDTKSIALTQTTLISLSGADLAIASSTFNTITNTLGNGSILSATVPSGDTVIIEDGSATSCSTTGNGGAIFVRLAGNGRFEMKGTSGMSFSNCKSNSVPESAQGTTGNGNCVFLGLDDGAVNFSFGKVRFPSAASTENPAPFLFVESDDLETSITTTRFSFLLPFTFNETDYVKYHGMVTSEFTTHQSLVPYLNKLTEAYLSTAGSDAGKCGSDVTPCESLAKALTWLIVDTTDTESLPHYQVLLMNNGIHNTTIDMEEYILSVTTIDTLATQDLTTTGSSFILGDKATGDTTLALRNMHLKWTGAAGTFLDQSKGIVMLSACSLVIDDATTLFSSSALIVKGGTLTLSELTLNCNTLSTSPLLEMSGGKADISALLISNAQLASSLFTGSGDLTIKSSSFSSLSSSTSSSILFTLSTSSHKLHIGSAGTPVEFTSCSSSTDGGALNVALTAGSLSIESTSFKKCWSSLNGGAIFVDLTSLSSPGSYSLSSVTFGTAAADLNSCGQGGSDLFISVASYRTSLISSSSLRGSYFEAPFDGASTFASSEMSKYEFSEIDGSSGSILYLLHPYTGGQLFVDSESAADNALCGHSYLACKTLPLGHSSSKDSSDGPKASVFLSANVALSAVFSSSKTVIWTTDQSSKKTITLTTDDTITISSKLLSLAHLILTVSAGTFSKSFFTVNGGSLSVSDCEFKSIASSASGSAISATLGTETSLSLSAVAFTSCTSTADGGALSITLTTGSLSLQSTSFKKCSSSLNGGAIWMDLLGMSSPSQYSLIDTVFGTGADANHAARSGHHVYVIAKDLSEVIVASRWAGSFDTAEDEDLWGMDSESNEMSLLPILKSHVIAVGENGSDDADGTFASPFRTFHRCLESTKGQAGPFTVEIVKKATIGRSCSLASQPSTTVHVRGSGSSGDLLCTVSDESSESGTSISSGPTAMVLLSLQTLTFSQIVFSSFSAQKSVRFVFSLMSSSRLVLTSCSISSSAPLSVSLVSASSSSSFSAVALATSALSFVGKASLVVCGDRSRISIASSSFSSTSFDAGAFVWGSTRGDVSVEDTAFVGCGGREFGSLIRVKMAGCTASIKKCRFVSCSTVLSLSERGKRRIVGGGCVLVEMARQTPVPRSLPPSCADLSLSSFTSCSLINTDLPHSLSSSSQFVGGSAFAIVSHDNSGLVKLPKVALSNCTCEHFAGDGVFDGGVVVGEGQHVRTDRRGCVVDKCRLGSIVLH
ncbi:putative large repetitive protein [Blattamonas nauphoetae]|uniref:Large repetitive protein n=1 Tax=Blattamonas nauphoetae TaxID=2049346 RepID=A0ABQ9Y590_9EUKA|nr:putative large repetitive protein [Blattamonas nauphoetae]